MSREPGGGTTFSLGGGSGSVSYTLAEIGEAGAGIARLAQLMDPLLDRLESERLWLRDAAQTAAVHPYAALDAMQRALWAGHMGVGPAGRSETAG